MLATTGAAMLATSGRVSAQAPSTLRIAVPADVLSWDAIAHVHGAAMPLYRSVFDSPLIQSADKLKIVPNVVSSWKWLDAGKTLELTFRDDVYFHNGDKLTAEDFKFTYLDRLKAEPTLALAGVFGKVISDIEVKSPAVAVVHMTQVMPTVLNWFTSLANFIMPKDYFTRVGKEEFLKKPVGSGPYKLVEYQQGTRATFEAFDRYWGGKPQCQRVVFDVMKDPAARVAAIQSGTVDLSVTLPVREAMRLSAVAGLAGEVKPLTSVISILVRDIGDFANPDVRLAAHHAINKDAISKALFSGQAATLSVVGVPTMPGYDPGYAFSYDPAKARELLAKAGFTPEKPARITFYSTNGVQANDWEMARVITGMWKQVGIDAKLEALEVAKYFELNAAGKLPEATFWFWNGPMNDPEQFTGTLLNPDSRFSVLKSEDMKQKLAPLLVEFDQDKRIAGYKDVDRHAAESGYVIPMMQGVTGIAYKKDLQFDWFDTGWFEPWRISRKA